MSASAVAGAVATEVLAAIDVAHSLASGVDVHPGMWLRADETMHVLSEGGPDPPAPDVFVITETAIAVGRSLLDAARYFVRVRKATP